VASLVAFAATPKNECGSSTGLACVTVVPTPGNETVTRRRSSTRSSVARHPPDHISPPKNSSRPSSTRKKGTNCSDERPSDPRSSRSPGSKSCSAKTKGSSEPPSLLAESPRSPPSHRTFPSGMVNDHAVRSVSAVPSPPLLAIRVQVSIVGDPG